MTKQETKQNNQTDVNPDERLAEIEEASAGLDPSFLAQKSTKLSKWQIEGIQDYKRVGLSLRETAKTVATSAWYNLSLLEGCTGPGSHREGFAWTFQARSGTSCSARQQWERRERRCHAGSDRAEGAEWRTVQLSRISDGSTTLICGL